MFALYVTATCPLASPPCFHEVRIQHLKRASAIHVQLNHRAVVLVAAVQAEVAAAHNAVSKLGGKLLGVEPVQSWGPEGQRTAVVVAKTGSTPAKYPRAPGTPNKKPL